MISVTGQLAIRTIHGRNGAFNVGRLTTSIGEFVIKNAELDQYREGKYDGDFVIAQIRPSTYNTSGRMVHCVKFQKELPGLDSPPWPGELGQRIYDNVSAQAWKLWEDRMKMILNEYRLMPWQKEAQELVQKHMEDFFFGESAALPPGYVPQQTK